MPAAAVIREGQALSKITGRKESVDSKINYWLNFKTNFKNTFKTVLPFEFCAEELNFMFRNKLLKNMKEYLYGESYSLAKSDVEGRKYRERTRLDTLVVYTLNSECCNLKNSIFRFLS